MNSNDLKKIVCLIGLILLGILFFIGTVTALYPEYVGSTFVVWNITNVTVTKNVVEVSINGKFLDAPDPAAHWVVSDGLEPNTKTAILVHYQDNTISRCWTTTRPAEETEQETFFSSLNTYFFLGLLIVILVLAHFTYRELGYIAAVLSIVGFAVTLDDGFGLAFSYVIVFIISLLVVYTDGD